MAGTSWPNLWGRRGGRRGARFAFLALAFGLFYFLCIFFACLTPSSVFWSRPLYCNMRLSSYLLASTGSALLVFSQCPDFSQYSREHHPPFSVGRYNLSYQRPDPSCRTLSSPRVEAEITRLNSKITDPDLFRLFQNSCKEAPHETAEASY